METMDKIRELHCAYEPSAEYRSVFLQSGFVGFSGQIAGSGKDSVKDAVAKICGGVSCQSYTDRDWRPSDGPKNSPENSYIYLSPEEMLAEIVAGTLIEYQPLRSYSYATPGKNIASIVRGGGRPFKDIEPNGLMKLREIAGTDGIVKAVLPLPDLEVMGDGRTRWEHLLTNRDYGGDSLVNVLRGSRGEKASVDLALRLDLAAKQGDQVQEFGLVDDANTLFIVNTFGRLGETAKTAASFVNHGKITAIPHGTPSPTDIRANLNRVEDIAREALAAAA